MMFNTLSSFFVNFLSETAFLMKLIFCTNKVPTVEQEISYNSMEEDVVVAIGVLQKRILARVYQEHSPS